MSTAPFQSTVTVTITEPALGPLRSLMRAALEQTVEARAVERARYLVEQFGADGDASSVVTAPRSVLITAIDGALRGPHPSAALRALITLRRTVMEAEEDVG